MTDVRINHVAFSMPTSVMTEETRHDIQKFYGEVFKWVPCDTGEPGNPLVMLMSDPKLFVFIFPEDEAMKARPMDHFGIEVFSESELDEALEKAKNFKEKDDRVRIIDKAVHHYAANTELRPDLADKSDSGIDMVSCYMGYILPLMVEIQYFRP
jgi:hypothetical protein